jgi:protein phosphatase
MTYFGITDKGSVRAVNQDAFRAEDVPERGAAALVLCDGMGGERAGEVASETAAGAFAEYALERFSDDVPPLADDTAREAAAWANLRVYDRAMRDDACRGMGTTLVAAVITAEDCVIVNGGDSRCYWMAEGQLQQVTKDHSLVQEMVDAGLIDREQARTHPRRNVITRAVGMERRVPCDIFRIDLRPGDTLLLCSDGLSNMVTDRELAGVLSHETELKDAGEKLLSMALERGAPDNVTVLLARL